MADKNDDMKARMLAALEAKRTSQAHQAHKPMLNQDQRFAADNAVVELLRFSARPDHRVQVLLVKPNRDASTAARSLNHDRGNCGTSALNQ